MLRSINASTGAELWTIMNYGDYMYGGAYPVASGYLVALNTYNSQLYCYGQGPSQLTVTAPDTAATLGTPLVIRGILIDIAAGTKQNEQAERFPNGVPAVSDASQSAWMEYVYMQKPRPTDATGVTVNLSVIDANGNSRPIGTTTTTSSGTYSLTWTPDIPGDYQVIAAFAGTNSYYPSTSQTTFTVTQAAPTASPYPIVTLPPTEMYIAAATVAIIVAIAIGFVATILVLRKRP